MAILFIKKNEKIHSAAVDGHQLMKKHTTTNQNTVSVIGGCFVTRIDRGQTLGGIFHVVWGCECGNKKNLIKKSVRGLRWPPDEDFTRQPTKKTQV
jgi:hypothetical protein